jgi:hypothetical protein
MTPKSDRRISRAGLAVSVLVVFAILAAALPQPAQAQTNDCITTHVVQSGETTGQIAHRYDMKWRQIARANDLPVPTTLKTGQRLCIPDLDDDDETTSTSASSFSVTVAGGRVFVTINKLSVRSVFNVKARATEVGVGGWRKLGNLKVGRNETVSTVYSLPNALKDSTYISVCFKNVTTDELICTSTINIP